MGSSGRRRPTLLVDAFHLQAVPLLGGLQGVSSLHHVSFHGLRLDYPSRSWLVSWRGHDTRGTVGMSDTPFTEGGLGDSLCVMAWAMIPVGHGDSFCSGAPLERPDLSMGQSGIGCSAGSLT